MIELIEFMFGFLQEGNQFVQDMGLFQKSLMALDLQFPERYIFSRISIYVNLRYNGVKKISDHLFHQQPKHKK